jgi:hypothetical protein
LSHLAAAALEAVVCLVAAFAAVFIRTQPSAVSIAALLGKRIAEVSITPAAEQRIFLRIYAYSGTKFVPFRTLALATVFIKCASDAWLVRTDASTCVSVPLMRVTANADTQAIAFAGANI